MDGWFADTFFVQSAIADKLAVEHAKELAEAEAIAQDQPATAQEDTITAEEEVVSVEDADPAIIAGDEPVVEAS